VTLFPYIRASQVLAHGKLFSKKNACKFYGVASGTYDGWNSKLKSDSELQNLFAIALKKLTEEWQKESINTLKKGLFALNTAFDNNPFETAPQNVNEARAWAYCVDCSGRAEDSSE